ncbi:MAG: S8 family serine peptidase [Proteobacteria bacterium]|jgi:subtilisin family serine protease|nr:S8 family serine peptidase [Pseudomonadota bacterium]
MRRLFPDPMARKRGARAPVMARVLLALSLAVGLVSCVSVDTRPIEERLSRQIMFTISIDQYGDASGFDEPYAPLSEARKSTFVIQQILSFHGLKKIATWPIKSLGLHAVVAEISRKKKVEESIEELSTDNRVETVQSVKTYDLLGYNDPYFELQSVARSDDIEYIHHLATGKDIVVGVIDTGMDRQHPELRGRVIYSRNHVDHDQDRFDTDEHGTAVAGIIGSTANNEVGIVGVAPDVKLMSFKSCWHDRTSRHATCDSVSLMKALMDAIDQQPDILNLSLSGPDDPLIRRLLRLASDRGIVLLGAKDDKRYRSFPASMPEVIAVGASLDEPFPDGGYGILAPGTDVLTTTPGATYAFKSGSSMATAYVSGIAALIKERQPELNGRQIEEHLRATSRIMVFKMPVVDICAAVRRGDEACPQRAVASASH